MAFFNNFFLEHLHFFLVFLHTDIDAVHENVPVNYLGASEYFRGLLVAETADSLLLDFGL